MDRLVINGGRRLYGEISVGGSKNAALPILAGLLLTNDRVTVENVPDLTDVRSMLSILRELGADVSIENGIIECSSASADCTVIPEKHVKDTRSSVIFLGAALARSSRVWIAYPGGCEIGRRPVDIHIEALRQLGVEIIFDGTGLQCSTRGLKGADIYLSFPSVGATENVMLAAARADGRTVIRNAAREPEIRVLQDFINAMGGEIYGAGSDVITIIGKKNYHGTHFSVIADRIVAGTYVAAAAVTGSDLYIRNAPHLDMDSVLYKFMCAGVEIIRARDGIRVIAPKRMNAVEHTHTMPYPGFPTDMQPQLTATLATAEGTSLVRENIFENRFKSVLSLCDMGACITMKNERTAQIKGVHRLHGANVQGTDLRAAAALVVAALSAEGTTKIERYDYINRGYENMPNVLAGAGADIYVERDTCA